VVVSDQWPAVGYENLLWDARGRDDAGSREDRRRAYGSYRAAVPALIAARSYPLTGELAGVVDDATAELARYDVELGGKPHGLDAVMLRTESAASSQIENLTASARAIALAELGETSKANASLVVANAHAMRRAIDLADELSPATVLAMHHALLSESDPAGAGRWRQQPVWIGVSALSPIGADFVAPSHPQVPQLVDDVLEFGRRTDQPVLAQAAIAHAQFETIHPFTDGNGRTGRALLHAMLRHHRVTRRVTVPVSAGLLHDVAGYHDALDAYRAGDPDRIIGRVADATFRAVRNGRALADALEQIRAEWQDLISARRDSAVWRVAEEFLARPVLDAAELGRLLGLRPTNVHRHVNRLTEVGVLVAVKRHRGSTAWRADRVLQALDAFSVRAGRRTGV
jgi:Fic family protein